MKKSLILLCAVCFFMSATACQKNDNTDVIDTYNENGIAGKNKNGYSTYIDGKFGFSVEFPVTWSCEHPAYWEATKDTNSSPDSDVYFYIGESKDNYICVYGQHGTITPVDIEEAIKNDFINDKGNEGILYIKDNGEIIEGKLYFNDNKHISALLKLDSNIYIDNEQDILTLLKSITY